MDDVVIGILALLVGALLCFNGYVALRVVITVWGAFVGFALGAGAVAWFSHEGVLVTVLGWVVGACLAVLVGMLAYAYYAVAVVVAMAAFGFVLGSAGMAALGVTWSWAVALTAVALGVLLALTAIVANLPMVLLVVTSAFSGAAMLVGGLMFLTGALDTTDLSQITVTEQIGREWYWYAGYLLLAVLGTLTQLRSARSSATVRDTWQDSVR